METETCVLPVETGKRILKLGVVIHFNTSVPSYPEEVAQQFERLMEPRSTNQNCCIMFHFGREIKIQILSGCKICRGPPTNNAVSLRRTCWRPYQPKKSNQNTINHCMF